MYAVPRLDFQSIVASAFWRKQSEAARLFQPFQGNVCLYASNVALRRRSLLLQNAPWLCVDHALSILLGRFAALRTIVRDRRASRCSRIAGQAARLLSTSAAVRPRPPRRRRPRAPSLSSPVLATPSTRVMAAPGDRDNRRRRLERVRHLHEHVWTHLAPRFPPHTVAAAGVTCKPLHLLIHRTMAMAAGCSARLARRKTPSDPRRADLGRTVSIGRSVGAQGVDGI